MRSIAICVCTLLLSSTALAQKGGPNPDPLGDRQHAEKEKPERTKRAKPEAATVKVKTKRVVRVSRSSTTTGPTAKGKASSKARTGKKPAK